VADPLELLDRIASRFLGATLWYVPTDRASHATAAWYLWLQRLWHPLPFLGCLVLIASGSGRRRFGMDWTTIAIYALYLMPYVLVSYYPRYALPLFGAKTLLVTWALDALHSLLHCPPQVQRSTLIAAGIDTGERQGARRDEIGDSSRSLDLTS
jgi:hypothetical protein